MKLIQNWRSALRMYSVQAQTVNLAILGAWQALPDDLRGSAPSPVVAGIVAALLVLGIAGRLIAQPAVQAGE